MTADPLTRRNTASDDGPCGKCTHLYSAHDSMGCHPVPGRHECNCRHYVPARADLD